MCVCFNGLARVFEVSLTGLNLKAAFTRLARRISPRSPLIFRNTTQRQNKQLSPRQPYLHSLILRVYIKSKPSLIPLRVSYTRVIYDDWKIDDAINIYTTKISAFLNANKFFASTGLMMRLIYSNFFSILSCAYTARMKKSVIFSSTHARARVYERRIKVNRIFSPTARHKFHASPRNPRINWTLMMFTFLLDE